MNISLIGEIRDIATIHNQAFDMGSWMCYQQRENFDVKPKLLLAMKYKEKNKRIQAILDYRTTCCIAGWTIILSGTVEQRIQLVERADFYNCRSNTLTTAENVEKLAGDLLDLSYSERQDLFYEYDSDDNCNTIAIQKLDTLLTQ